MDRRAAGYFDGVGVGGLVGGALPSRELSAFSYAATALFSSCSAWPCPAKSPLCCALRRSASALLICATAALSAGEPAFDGGEDACGLDGDTDGCGLGGVTVGGTVGGGPVFAWFSRSVMPAATVSSNAT